MNKVKNKGGKNPGQDNMPNAHLHELFIDELRDMYNAERQLTKGLKTLQGQAKNKQLKSAFEAHLKETEGHIESLKKVFEMMGLAARGKKCKAMEGLLSEAEEIVEEFEDSEAIDAALIVAAQKVEHYEIASYGCLATFASLMEHTEAAEILNQILEEEKATDAKLTDIAMSWANVEESK